MASKLILTMHDVGTARLVGSTSSSLSFKASATGSAANAGTTSSVLSLKGYDAGRIGISGTSKSSLSFSAYARGVILNKGVTSSSLTLVSTSGRSRLYGVSESALSLAGSARGTVTIKGSSASSLLLTGFARGYLVETDDGVWVVNLFHGGHSRYTGDLTGATKVSAYALTGSDQLGSDRAKYVHDLYAHLRTDGDVEITTITDEQKERSGYIISSDDRTGIHRRRMKLAKGIKGTNWQFKVSNVDGSNFTIKTIEVPPVASQRVQ